jgi:hypothetical protein
MNPRTAGDAPDSPASCEASAFMSVDAALCIARANGLPEGLSGLQGSLVYNGQFRRVIYAVENTLHKAADRAGGDTLAIDAISGAVLDRGGWESIS